MSELTAESAATTPGDVTVVHARWLACVRDRGGPRRGRDQGELDLIEDGAVAIRGGVIAAVGPTDEVLAATDPAPLLDATGMLVAPGMVESHSHPVFVGDRPGEYAQRLAGATGADVVAAGGGIRTTMASTRSADDETLLRHVDWVARQLLAGGVTTLEAKSGYGGTLTDELRLLRLLAAAQAHTRMQVVPTFLGAHVLPPGTTESDYVDLVVDEMFPAVVEQGVAQLCDLVCEVGEFSAASATRVLAAARRHGLPARVHADASSPSDGWATSVAGGAIGVDHLTYTPADAVRDVGPTDTIAVLLPLAELAYLDPVSAPARAFVDTEVPVAIAGDYCSAVRATSLLSAVAVATSRFRLTPAEALVGATLNAAYAVGRGHDRGSLDVGKRGDLAVIDIGHPDLLGVSVGTVPVRDVVIGGTTAYRRLAQSWTPTTPPREAIAC